MPINKRRFQKPYEIDWYSAQQGNRLVQSYGPAETSKTGEAKGCWWYGILMLKICKVQNKVGWYIISIYVSAHVWLFYLFSYCRI